MRKAINIILILTLAFMILNISALAAPADDNTQPKTEEQMPQDMRERPFPQGGNRPMPEGAPNGENMPPSRMPGGNSNMPRREFEGNGNMQGNVPTENNNTQAAAPTEDNNTQATAPTEKNNNTQNTTPEGNASSGNGRQFGNSEFSEEMRERFQNGEMGQMPDFGGGGPWGSTNQQTKQEETPKPFLVRYFDILVSAVVLVFGFLFVLLFRKKNI